MPILQQRLTAYSSWRDRLAADIESYQGWLQEEGLIEAEDELKIYELLESLRSDKLCVALVAEFSRGKTELINALFFSDHKRRLLPSTAGRTTMCPTEIQYDADREPCVMLLPIETRRSGTTVSDYKRDPINWTILPLDLKDPAQMSSVLAELSNAKKVSPAEANALGLVPPNGESQEQHFSIPVWRHALINYPHPLLKQGLVILDTPGLNALGVEPELTLSMLPRAHAGIFVLAAETRVTRTDLDGWKNHVRRAARPGAEGCIAVLNKIDTLWDDLRSPEAVNETIAGQVRETAHILGVREANVFPTSAQKALLSRVRGEPGLFERSGLGPLEDKLSRDLVLAKRSLLREKVIGDIGAMMKTTSQLLATRLQNGRAELAELLKLRGKSEAMLRQMTARLREQKKVYDREMESFEVTRRMLADQVKTLLAQLSMSSFDALVRSSRKSMRDSWTTQGLRKAMETFFSGASKRMDAVVSEAKKLRILLDNVYKRFHTEHGLAKIKPTTLSVSKFRKEFKRLEQDAEAFRKSPAMVMIEQHFVIRKFFITLAAHAREVFRDCSGTSKAWAKSILTPVYTQIQEHKIMIDRRMENFEKIEKDFATLGQRVRQLRGNIKELEAKRDRLRAMLDQLYRPVSRTH